MRSTLLAALLCGCTPPIVGGWAMTALEVNGDDYELEQTIDGVDEVNEGSLNVDSDLNANFVARVSERGSGVKLTTKDEYVGYAIMDSKSAYTLSMFDSDTQTNLDLDCGLDQEELDCEGLESDGDRFRILFEAD